MSRSDIPPILACAVGLLLIGLALTWTRPKQDRCFLSLESNDTAYILAERMKIVFGERGYTVVEKDLDGDRCGHAEGRVITLEPGLNPREQLWVLLHERSHVLLGHPTSTPVSEIEAETVAMLVEARYGLCIEASIDYIAHWMKQPRCGEPNDKRIAIAYSRLISEL